MTTLIDTKAIASMLGLSIKHVREQLVHRADFPRPAMVLSVRTKRWDIQDIEAWLVKRRKQAAR